MLYFFYRESDFVHCEIREAADPTGFELVITEPGGFSHTEHYSSSQKIYQRWLELQAHFHADGWHGPAGHDGRT